MSGRIFLRLLSSPHRSPGSGVLVVATLLASAACGGETKASSAGAGGAAGASANPDAGTGAASSGGSAQGGGGIGAAGGGGASGGTGGAAQGGEGGGGTGGNPPICADLESQYAAKLPGAKACNFSADGGFGCDVLIDNQLACPCPTYVSSKFVEVIDSLYALQKQWKAAGCTAVCPDIDCKAPGGCWTTTTGPDGVCKDL